MLSVVLLVCQVLAALILLIIGIVQSSPMQVIIGILLLILDPIVWHYAHIRNKHE